MAVDEVIVLGCAVAAALFGLAVIVLDGLAI